jgi:hypothetical protein
MSLGASSFERFVPMITQEVIDSQVMDLLSFCLRKERRHTGFAAQSGACLFSLKLPLAVILITNEVW